MMVANSQETSMFQTSKESQGVELLLVSGQNRWRQLNDKKNNPPANSEDVYYLGFVGYGDMNMQLKCNWISWIISWFSLT